MNNPPWKPWRDVVTLREDVRSGELSLKIFAADIYDVVMDQGPRVYRDPAEFFALTYPTFALRDLARDVMLRLAGRSDKAIRQLELTYGGGKTHTLITMYHLANEPRTLPPLPAVAEFVNHIGFELARARVSVLPFDKIDVEKGMQTKGPGGQTRWLRQPWSILAYQIAGDEGLRLLHAGGDAEERDSAPAENLLTDLLARPAQEGLATLVLIDEVLMYAREKVGMDPAWKDRLANFFQYLTQAAAKVDRCAVVASLLATDPAKSDTLGRQILLDLQTIFLREREEGVQPVGKADVAEVLRRRFFTADSIRDRAAFRPHVVAALKGVAALDEQTRREASAAEERYLQSYPFHPDLTEAFYTKWTQLERFQRTRGILRTFALALREAAAWDTAPLIGPNVFLSTPGETTLSEAARELASAAVTEDGVGNRQEWSVILESELAKARSIQEEIPTFRHREIEQAVLATFLHSQPIGQKALDRDLLVLLGPTRPDRIELDKGLKHWTEVSWFLDESAVAGGAGAAKGTRSWRLGSRPNLRQMHYDASQRVQALVGPRLLEEIERCKSLTAGASAAGVRVHLLPKGPGEVEDDDRFHFVILSPSAASDSGKPSAEAVRYLTETTSADRPRSQKNAILLAAPSREGLESMRLAVRDALAWDEVEAMLTQTGEIGAGSSPDTTRDALLKAYKQEARAAIPGVIRQAYCIVVTFDDRGQPQAFKLPASTEALFSQIKGDTKARIQETRIEPDALLPEGPYNLWREGETARRVAYLVGAFASDPRLPKMLNRAAITETLVEGCQAGSIVLRLRRPDGSSRTFWRERPDGPALEDPTLEAVLPEAAELTSLPSTLLHQGTLPGLWTGDTLSFRDLAVYFAGGRVISVPRQGYEQPQAMPCVSRGVLEHAVRAAVQAGALWLTSGGAGFYKEEVPAGFVGDDAEFHEPPAPFSPMDLLPPNLPAAWPDPTSTTTAAAIWQALSAQAGKPVPWSVIRSALGAAFQGGILARAADSATWPAEASDAQFIVVQMPTSTPPPPPPGPDGTTQTTGGTRTLYEGTVTSVALVDLASHEIQDLADGMPALLQTAVDYQLVFKVAIELTGDDAVPDDVVARVNALLKDICPRLQVVGGSH